LRPLVFFAVEDSCLCERTPLTAKVAKERKGRLREGQEGVHGAGPEALEVEGDELETECLEDECELRGEPGRHCTRQLFARDLYAHNFSVMPNSKLAEAESA